MRSERGLICNSSICVTCKMSKWFHLLPAACALLALAAEAVEECTDTGKRGGLSVSMHTNGTGEWLTISAVVETKNTTKNAVVDLKHSVTECDGRNIIRIQGIVRDGGGKKPEGLTFYPKTGTNAAIINDGRTAVKIMMEEALDGVVFTSRPLKNDEIFEVKLEKKGSKFSYSMGIGVTTHSPETHEILPHMNREKTGTWLYYGEDAWNNGTKVITKYGVNAYNLQVGERVGVMRSKYGALHYFVNGIDQGPAATNLPQTLYGVFELFGNAGQVSIVDPQPI